MTAFIWTYVIVNSLNLALTVWMASTGVKPLNAGVAIGALLSIAMLVWGAVLLATH